MPVYYNAWMYDDHNDPLMSLLLVMTKQCGGAYNAKINTKSLGERLLAVASSLPISIKKLNPATLINDLQEGKMDILSAVKTEEDIKECVRDVFNDIIVGKLKSLWFLLMNWIVVNHLLQLECWKESNIILMMKESFL